MPSHAVVCLHCGHNRQTGLAAVSHVPRPPSTIDRLRQIPQWAYLVGCAVALGLLYLGAQSSHAIAIIGTGVGGLIFFFGLLAFALGALWLMFQMLRHEPDRLGEILLMIVVVCLTAGLLGWGVYWVRRGERANPAYRGARRIFHTGIAMFLLGMVLVLLCVFPLIKNEPNRSRPFGNNPAVNQPPWNR